ncbi:hypothetical protein PV08_10776 [Exophiala spinifera]|uniref:Uncharacterized protein n=1 Tax=Exophiala spinifera TaxID=91928 RepID=A0A0D1Y931_9EURO|nr:uncharacterized protein PV08_10776 [Exophiala spinifera]KIW11476.1 hypothetical protein PV08_10776 [Exophiala spinifera]
MRFLASEPYMPPCGCTSPLAATPTVSAQNKVVIVCRKCDGVIEEQPPENTDNTTPFPFSDLPLVAQRCILECFEFVPKYPYMQDVKPWEVSVWDIDRATVRPEFLFGSQPDHSLIRDIHIGTMETHPAAKEWKEFLEVAKTRKSLLSVSKHVRTEWAPRFWSTTTIHIGHQVPGSAHNVSPQLFDETFLSKIEPQLLPFLRNIVFYPLVESVNAVGVRIAHGDTVGVANAGYFTSMQELGDILLRHRDLANLTNLSVFYRPLPQLIPRISEITLTANHYNQLRERWGFMDQAGSWRDFETALSQGLLKGFKIKKEVGVKNPEEGTVRTLIWWKLSFTKPMQ